MAKAGDPFDRADGWAADDSRLAAVLEHSSDIVTILDDQGRVLWNSPATTSVLGFTELDELGIRLLDLIHPDDRQQVVDALVRGLAEGRGASAAMQVRVASADGSWRHIESVASNHLDDPEVRGIIINSRDVTERVEAMEQLRHAAYHDSLTGLPNRALLFDRMEQALARSTRSRRDLAVFYLDLDGFKAVNDRYGHAEGDRVLREVAARVLAVIRPADTAARLGGDELVVMAEGLTIPTEAVSMAKRIIDGVSAPSGSAGAEVTVSVGIGYGREIGPEELVERADRALYRAKTERSGWWIELSPSGESDVGHASNHATR